MCGKNDLLLQRVFLSNNYARFPSPCCVFFCHPCYPRRIYMIYLIYYLNNFRTLIFSLADIPGALCVFAQFTRSTISLPIMETIL